MGARERPVELCDDAERERWPRRPGTAPGPTEASSPKAKQRSREMDVASRLHEPKERWRGALTWKGVAVKRVRAMLSLLSR